MSGRSSTSGATSANATSEPIAVFTANCAAVPGTRPSGPANGEAATR
ncbi:Uncharacterised protein [Mycobacterium tuberculosis]|nr:Uncharacterised protein [Mycobacterium tuberculosis]